MFQKQQDDHDDAMHAKNQELHQARKRTPDNINSQNDQIVSKTSEDNFIITKENVDEIMKIND